MKKTQPKKPKAEPIPDRKTMWMRLVELGRAINTQKRELDSRIGYAEVNIGRVQVEVEGINRRFKPVVFLPKELDQLNVDQTKVWNAVARDDQPYTPGPGNPYSPPKGFPLGWTPPKGTTFRSLKGVQLPELVGEERGDLSWKPPGWEAHRKAKEKQSEQAKQGAPSK